MDIIHIKNLEVFANHGVFEEENRLGQKFIINADLYTDFRDSVGHRVFTEDFQQAGYTPEDLDSSIDYGMASEKIAEFLTMILMSLLRRLQAGLRNICSQQYRTYTKYTLK